MRTKILQEKNVGGAVTVIFGLMSLYEAKRMYPYSKDFVTGDHAMPGVIGILLILLGMGLISEKVIENKKVDFPAGKTLMILISSIGVLFLYCLLIMLVGYVISTFIISILLIRIIGNYRWIFSMVTGAIITAVLYFIFIVLLKTPFPIGIFAF
nr:tripartite tricarboxylate transporter TctB family protein [Neobacillus sp. Marseille-Q6967]